ncbi:hypothetical protein [Algoriphagus yeomjeoni]|uniref:6-bladed beta-propeller protein n=1 Tax=Algoriphagus yeomjeoni TaxID=291403 RepID=A0A327P2F1_9BACT|nr:hypothetical protein [Algoriphagus yeomjeoni]RAI85741.1 hypothetical protein LV83_03517 [Algoriphagus yeomjeoni]
MRLNYIFILFIFFGCSPQKPDELSSATNPQLLKNIVITNLELEQVQFNYEGFVGKGSVELEEDKLLFLDRLSMQVIEFNKDGEFLRIPISNGEGPSEIPVFQTYTSYKGRKYFMNGWTLFEFNESNSLLNRTLLDFSHSSDIKEVESNPKVDDIGIYEVKYWGNQLEVRDGFLYTKIESSNPGFNFVMHKEYYEKAPLYGKVDLNTGKVVELLGKRPAIYQNYSYLPHFDYYFHDFLAEEIYISFEPDSLIYILNEDFEVQEAFGNKGVGMDQSYREVSTVEDWEDYWRINQTQKGFYKYIKVIPEDELVFRTYTAGNPDPNSFELGTNPQRMQVYHQKRLVGDVEVPNFFSVIGKIGDYYYADGSLDNPDNEEIVVYKFKLNY